MKLLIKRLVPKWFLISVLLPSWHKLRRLNFHEVTNDKAGPLSAPNYQSVLKNNVLFVSGELYTPGHIYRVERYLESYYELGISGQWVSPEVAGNSLHLLDSCKMIIFWRTLFNEHIQLILDKAKALSIFVCFDIDDYIFNPEIADPEIIDSYRIFKSDISLRKNRMNNFKKLLLLSDIGICPTITLKASMEREGIEAYHLPNGYCDKLFNESRSLYKKKLHSEKDSMIRIGYAGGTLSHQRDLAMVMPAIIRILSVYPQTIFVFFGKNILLNEFPELIPYHNRIEDRDSVLYKNLQSEIIRFDINLAPLDINPFCEAKSELKYFEAALLQIPTIASPTQVYKQCISQGINGFLASTPDEWFTCLNILVKDESLRKNIGRQAFLHVLYEFGPEQRNHLVFKLLSINNIATLFPVRDYSLRREAYKFVESPKSLYEIELPKTYQEIQHEELLCYESSKISLVGIFIVFNNDADILEESLETIKHQTRDQFDLVLIDNASSDGSSEIALKWLLENNSRFLNCSIYRCLSKENIGKLKNLGFLKLDVRYILYCTPEYHLSQEILQKCYDLIHHSGAALIYPKISILKDSEAGDFSESEVVNSFQWNQDEIRTVTHIYPLALISKACWSKIGGFQGTSENYDNSLELFLQFISKGFWGIQLPKVMATKKESPILTLS